jgi:hypothetical protein
MLNQFVSGAVHQERSPVAAKRLPEAVMKDFPERLVHRILDSKSEEELLITLTESLVSTFQRAESLSAKLGRVRKTLNETVVNYRRVKKGFKTHQRARSGRWAGAVRSDKDNAAFYADRHRIRYEAWAAANPELAAKWPEKVAVG